MLLTLFLITAVLFVAYANGANDNFKGVATLFGSQTTSYRAALLIATAATVAGAIASLWFAEALVHAFSGRGLVPATLAASPPFLLAVAIGTGFTVILATRLAFPISTTHALIGALVGAGLVGTGGRINMAVLGSVFLLPLLISPVAATLLTMPLYRSAHWFVERYGITRRSCVCIAPGQFVAVASRTIAITAPSAMVGNTTACVDKYSGQFFGISAQSAVDGAHYLSAAAVCFARGLNDTPKIVGLLLVVEALNLRVSMLAIALAMAAGGLLHARNIAQTMSHRISRMNDGQAFTANLVTAFMVIVASRFGLPVSTTHVSVGAITGIGLVNGSANKRVVGNILASWLLTLPIAAAGSAVAYSCLVLLGQ